MKINLGAVAIVCAAFVNTSAMAQNCNFNFESWGGRCVSCAAGQAYSFEGGDACYPCGAFCFSGFSATVPGGADIAQKSVNSSGSVSYPIRSNPTLDGQTLPFAQISDVIAIAQINPHAALTVARFIPKYYRNTPFLKGQAGSRRVASVESTQLFLDGVTDDVAWKKATRALPDDRHVAINWGLEKKVDGIGNVWRITSTLHDDSGVSYGNVYPSIEIEVTDKPYRLIRWSSK